jgi:hypothetical protein
MNQLLFKEGITKWSIGYQTVASTQKICSGITFLNARIDISFLIESNHLYVPFDA